MNSATDTEHTPRTEPEDTSDFSERSTCRKSFDKSIKTVVSRSSRFTLNTVSWLDSIFRIAAPQSPHPFGGGFRRIPARDIDIFQ